MRIIGGISKGRRLSSPKGSSIRPTLDRVKETIFNILGKEVEGKVVLDLFAGTGNLGMEALSRGALKTVFVEKAKEALRIIQKNLLQSGFALRSEVISKDVRRAIPLLERRGDAFDLIFMDPPYEKGWVQKILNQLRDHPIYHRGTILVIEHSRREPIPADLSGWEIIRQRMIGDTVLSFLKG